MNLYLRSLALCLTIGSLLTTASCSKKDTPQAPTTPNQGPASASYTLNGTSVTPVYIAPQTLSGDRFIVFGTNANARLTLFLQGLVPTVGTLQLNTTVNYARYNTDDFVIYSSNSGSSAQGTLKITAVNTTERRYSGTFNFVGGVVNPNPGSPATQTITNGTFTNLTY